MISPCVGRWRRSSSDEQCGLAGAVLAGDGGERPDGIGRGERDERDSTVVVAMLDVVELDVAASGGQGSPASGPRRVVRGGRGPAVRRRLLWRVVRLRPVSLRIGL